MSIKPRIRRAVLAANFSHYAPPPGLEVIQRGWECVGALCVGRGLTQAGAYKQWLVAVQQRIGSRDGMAPGQVYVRKNWWLE